MASPTVEQVLSRSLRAHGLVEPVASIDAAITRAAGIYGTAPTSHLGLAARLHGYTPAALEHERLSTRSILRVPGPRGSVFLAPRELAPTFLTLARPRTVRRTLAGAGMTEVELERWMDRIETALAGTRLSAREIRERLGEDAPDGPVLTLVLRGMAHEGRIVAAEPVGGERATAFRYARMADWAPGLPEVPDVESALGVMAPMWMAANGPGTVDDLAWWAGVTKRRARAALVAMGTEEVAVTGLPEPQWATPEVAAAADVAEPAGVVRLLPVWDAWVMSRRERARILDADIRPYVVDRSGNVTNTVTLDGRVVGTWDVVGELLAVWLAGPIAPEALEAAAERLRPVIDWQAIEHVDEPQPLDAGGQNAFRAPLRPRI